MKSEMWQCIDAGSEYCPCYLAETMNCITCSHLQGKDFCDCNWRGVCIYQEFIFLGNKKKDIREPREVPIVEKINLGSNIMIYTLKVNHTLARQLKQPGSYIFARNKSMKHFFDVPISIMDVDDNEDLIKIAVEIHGVKTRAIKDVKDSLLIRGPYWNGIFGIEHLKSVGNSKCLIIARGIAQAPAVHVIKYLRKKENYIDVIVDKGSIEHNLIKEYCVVNTAVENINLYSAEGKKDLQNIIKNHNYRLVFIGGSDYLQKEIKTLFHSHQDTNIAVTNNHEICCGEGVCGACTIYDKNGVSIRTCKSQITNIEYEKGDLLWQKYS